MNRQQMYTLIDDTYMRLVQLSNTKGDEYRGTSPEMLGNFYSAGERTGLNPLTALFFALDKHYQSLAHYVRAVEHNRPIALSEPIEGRLDDLILYAILAKGLIRDQNAAWPSPQEYAEDRFADHASQPATNAAPSPDAIPPPDAAMAADCSVRNRGADDGPNYALADEDNDIVLPHQTRGCNPDSISAISARVVQWASQAFPARSIDTVRLKLACHEIPELLVAIGLCRWDHIQEEIADVMILLLDIAHMRNIHIGEAILHKMAVNAQRHWAVGTDGISRHV